jgi:glutathione S-transferase
MKLYLNKASPYARLTMVVAHEKGLTARIEPVPIDPWASDEALLEVTPLAKVPALIAEDGEPLVESACICDYLDSVGSGPPLLPRDPAARLSTLRKYGLGRGLIDVAFGAVIEKRHASGSDGVLEQRWRAAVTRTISTLENLGTLGIEPDLGDLAIAVALGYLDLRMREVEWRQRAPRLDAWFQQLHGRESLRRTAPD